MKTFKVKNYKGNIVESLFKFQKAYKNMKIIEAKEDDGKLNVKAEAIKTSDNSFSKKCNKLIDLFKKFLDEVKPFLDDKTSEDQLDELDKSMFVNSLKGVYEAFGDIPSVSTQTENELEKAFADLKTDVKESKVTTESTSEDESRSNLDIWIGGYLYNSEDDFRNGDPEELANEFLEDYECNLPMDEIVSEIKWAQKNAEVDR